MEDKHVEVLELLMIDQVVQKEHEIVKKEKEQVVH